MSYILDALKKSEQESKVELSDEFNSSLTSEDQNGKQGNYWLQIFIVLLLIIIAATSGFLIGGGYQANIINQKVVQFEQPKFDDIGDEELALVLVNQQQVNQASTDQSEDNDAEQNSVENYFDQPENYNNAVIALRKAEFELEQQTLLAEQQQLDLAEQQRMQMQIQMLMSEYSQLPTANNNRSANNNVNNSQDIVENQDQELNLTLNEDDLEGISPELLKAFQSAISDTQGSTKQDKVELMNANSSLDEGQVKPLTQMPKWLQDSVPPLHFSLHMYSSDQASSWLRLNDTDYYTGSITNDGLIIESILPQKVILQYQGQRFSLPALSTW
ncbi:general secretion pathway protein GspB [Thalassotalea crassostreae]|uniref:general secretion pathway protein GspB n=1 Tax=Thalassotalea crassostreae TaxID=1763536 RepID=UPI0008388CA1|nr:general secretion pathway protein GspB [Thalassotalea crassostreae]